MVSRVDFKALYLEFPPPDIPIFNPAQLHMADLLSRAECMQDEQAVLEFIKTAWAKTAGISITKPSLRKQLFELGAEQARLQMQIRGATVPQPDGQTITAQQALVEMQVAGLQQPTSTVDEQSLRVFDMQDMVTSDEPQPRAFVLPALSNTTAQWQCDQGSTGCSMSTPGNA